MQISIIFAVICIPRSEYVVGNLLAKLHGLVRHAVASRVIALELCTDD